MNRFLLNRLNGGLNGGGSGGLRQRVTIALEPAARSSTLALDGLGNSGATWDADPVGSFRVGRFRAGGVTTPLGAKSLLSVASAFRASRATDLDDAGALVEYTNDQIRAGYGAVDLPLGLALEGAANNQSSNPRALNSATGIPPAPGVAPTGWAFSATDVTTTASYPTSGPGGASQVTVGGIVYQLCQWAGTTTSTSLGRLGLSNTVNGTIAQGINASFDAFIYAGSMANITNFQIRLVNSGTGNFAFTPTSTPTRFSAPFPFTTDVGTPFQITSSCTASAPVDITLAVGAPQAVDGLMLTSRVFPAPGVVGTSVRAADQVSITNPNLTRYLGVGASQGFLIADVQVPLVGPTLATNLVVAELCDGSYNNRLFLYIPAGNSQFLAVSFVGGAPSFTSAVVGTVVANTTARVGMRFSPAGVAVSMNGGVLSTSGVAISGGYDRLVLGNSFDFTSPMNGRISGFWAGPYVPTDAQLRAACTNGADVFAAMRS